MNTDEQWVVVDSMWTAVAGTTYQFDDLTAGKYWTAVRDGESGRPFLVRFNLAGPAPRLVGLQMDDGDPVTARQLREPRLAELEQAFAEFLAMKEGRAAGLREALEQDQARVTRMTDDEHWDRHSWTNVLEEAERSHSDWTADLGRGAVPALAPRGRGAAPPSSQELQAFASLYVDQLRRGRRGAISRAARQTGMHRSTAHRWVARCRELGLLSDAG